MRWSPPIGSTTSKTPCASSWTKAAITSSAPRKTPPNVWPVRGRPSREPPFCTESGGRARASGRASRCRRRHFPRQRGTPWRPLGDHHSARLVREKRPSPSPEKPHPLLPLQPFRPPSNALGRSRSPATSSWPSSPSSKASLWHTSSNSTTATRTSPCGSSSTPVPFYELASQTPWVGPCPPGQDEKMRSLVLRERKRYVMCLGQFNALAVCSAKLHSPLVSPILLSMPVKARRVRSLPRRFRLPSERPPRTRFSCTRLNAVHKSLLWSSARRSVSKVRALTGDCSKVS